MNHQDEQKCHVILFLNSSNCFRFFSISLFHVNRMKLRYLLFCNTSCFELMEEIYYQHENITVLCMDNLPFFHYTTFSRFLQSKSYQQYCDFFLVSDDYQEVISFFSSWNIEEHYRYDYLHKVENKNIFLLSKHYFELFSFPISGVSLLLHDCFIFSRLRL